MKLTWKVIAVCLAAGFIFGYFIGRKPSQNENPTDYKRLYTEYKEKAEKEKAETERTILEAEKQIEILFAVNEKKMAESKVLVEKIEVVNTQISDLKRELLQLTDKDEVIENQAKTIVLLEKNVSLEKKDKAKILSWGMNWETAYEKQVIISDSLREQLRIKEGVRKLAEELWDKSDLTHQKTIRKLKFEKTISILINLGFGLNEGIRMLRGANK